MREIRRQVLEQLRSGNGAVLATVIRKSGSAPQVPGSSALFDLEGLVAGTIGGGLMEEEIRQIAKSSLRTGLSDKYHFNLDVAHGQEGAICGGKATVLVDATPGNHLAVFGKMKEDISNRKEGCLLTIVTGKDRPGRSILRYWITEETETPEFPGLPQEVAGIIREELDHLSFRGFREIAIPGLQFPDEVIAYLEPMRPMPRLVIAGAGHVGKALAHLGSLLHFEVTVIDDREEYASKENVPDADHLIIEDFSTALGSINPDSETYIVIVTRGHGHDAEVLKACIGSDAAYIGMIGSSRKVAHIKGQFLAEGWATPEQWDRIYTPIGLDINSKSVQEIAISIAAQLVLVGNSVRSTDRGSGTTISTKQRSDV